MGLNVSSPENVELSFFFDLEPEEPGSRLDLLRVNIKNEQQFAVVLLEVQLPAIRERSRNMPKLFGKLEEK